MKSYWVIALMKIALIIALVLALMDRSNEELLGEGADLTRSRREVCGRNGIGWTWTVKGTRSGFGWEGGGDRLLDLWGKLSSK
jgi:hypothetical protein